MEFKAYKMDGLGNDFVIIDNRDKVIKLTQDQIIKICNRNFIGCDQLIFIHKNKNTDGTLEFFNSDGGLSGACGNGTRCVAYLIARENNKKKIYLTTATGELKSEILQDKIVTTEIGKAKTEWGQADDLLADIDESILLHYYNKHKEEIDEWTKEER